MSNQGGYDAGDQLGSSGQQRQTVRADDGILPVTIKQLREKKIDEDRNEVLIDNIPRKHISVVGMVKSCNDEDALGSEYIINDTTGDYTVKAFANDGDEKTFPINTWVYVCGRISSSAGNSITSFAIREITDFNQIAFHMLNACFVHLQATLGSAPGSLFTTHATVQQGASSTQAAVQQVTKMSEEERAEKVKDAVVKFLQSTNSENGTSVQQIIEALSNQYSTEDINNAIQSASFNGEIYATNEDEHYAPC